MFVAFVLVILFILLGILAGTYSVFLPFAENIGDVVDFNSAYYGAISGIERANLVLKYKQPGFEGSGGYFGTTKFGPNSDYISGNFGTLTKNGNGISRQISSRTTDIPSSGAGNIDPLLSTGDSIDFNQLPYFSPENIKFTIDTTDSTTRDVYTGTQDEKIIQFGGSLFSGQFRLPPKIKTAFSDSELCANITNLSCDRDYDRIYDDIAVNWILKGSYSGTAFSILPTVKINYTQDKNTVIENLDTMIRESVVNDSNGSIYFGKPIGLTQYNFNPILSHTSNGLTQHVVISSDRTTVESQPFRTLLEDTKTKDLSFSFNIPNLLYSENGNIYPFLEYQLSFPQPVADKFYTIQAGSVVGKYNVKIITKKSTSTESPIGDFTIIF